MSTEKVAEKATVVAKEQEVEAVKEAPAENNEPMVGQELPHDEEENRPQFVKAEKEDKLGKIARKLKENPAVKNIPTHVLELACIVKDNAEIRRFTSLAILNYLHQKNELRGKKGHVDFLWGSRSARCRTTWRVAMNNWRVTLSSSRACLILILKMKARHRCTIWLSPTVS